MTKQHVKKLEKKKDFMQPRSSLYESWAMNAPRASNNKIRKDLAET